MESSQGLLVAGLSPQSQFFHVDSDRQTWHRAEAASSDSHQVSKTSRFLKIAYLSETKVTSAKVVYDDIIHHCLKNYRRIHYHNAKALLLEVITR